MYRKIFSTLILVFVLVFTSFGSVFADDGPVPVPDASGLAISDGDVLVAPELQKATGPIQIVVRLTDVPLSVAVGAGAKQKGSTLKPAQQRSYLNTLNQKQDALLNQISGLGGVALGRVNKALNAVIVEVDASQIEAIATLPNVAAINPLGKYEVDLSETVPYIGAAAVQASGFDGTNVRVAVLDSGIDYTHYNLGGSGNVADFAANDPTVIETGTFPTWKVVGGFDFVGEAWTGATGSPALAPDPDPLDKGTGAGHGTHVSDIIAGKSTDGLHKGVAPGASLYAVGVCSKITTSCSGVALLEGMDFALDPNGDGNISDAVDVVNMSLGSNYGQHEDDLSFASANAVHMGVVVVAAAGNAADRPYIVSSPSTTPEVISVAQTQVPSAKLYKIVAGSATVGGSWQPWSAAPVLVSGALAYDTTNTATRIGCTNAAGASPWVGTPFTGKILLVDRGTCAISIKVSNGAAAGAIAVVIANNAAQAPGDLPPDFSFGGGVPSVAGYTITRADGTTLKTQAGLTATIDPATAALLVGNMVSSSARGPSVSFNAIKPDIGAPGASVSAQYGTGNGETAFGGTSGATPMVAGSAALVIQKFAGITPLEVKARLMNTAETNIGINPVGLPGVLAPITRIGGGEVRVNKAVAAKTAAWDANDLIGSLSFGYQALTSSTAFQKSVVVRNYTNTARTYTITPAFRYADDAASGAVTISAPATIKVAANSSASFNVKVKVDVTKLPVWNLNGGFFGGDGYRLQGFEFDGYVNIADATDNIHVAWQILPHRSAEVTPASTNVTLTSGPGALALSNAGGALDGRVDVFSLLSTSGRIPNKYLPGDGDNYAVIDLKNFGARLVGIGGGQFGIQFAVNTFGARAHPNYPAEFDIYLDTNMDGNDDFVIFNLENGGFGATGQNVVEVVNLNTGAAGIFFFSDADLNSGNIIMTAPLSFLGITPSTQFNVSVYAFDNYFTGNLTDAITGMTYTAGAPRYYADNPAPVVPQAGSTTLNIFALPGGDTASPSQLGLLLMYRDARQPREADAIFVTP
jgi:subtilisin family serine protease